MNERYKAEHTMTLPVIWSVRDTQTDTVVLSNVPECIARTEANKLNLGA